MCILLSSLGIPDTSKKERKNKIKLSDAEWKERLTKEQYHVCRNHGTERASVEFLTFIKKTLYRKKESLKLKANKRLKN